MKLAKFILTKSNTNDIAEIKKKLIFDSFFVAEAREPVLVYTRDVSDGAAYQSTVFTSKCQ